MKKIARILPALGLFLLMGCLPPPAPQELPLHPDYGPPPPQDYQQMIQAEFAPSFFSNVLFGSKPESYEFSQPIKSYVEASRILTMPQTFGWAVCGTLVRREKYSGYPRFDGPIPFYALFKNGKIVEKLIGQTTYDHTVPHILNEDIKKVCTRTIK